MIIEVRLILIKHSKVTVQLKVAIVRESGDIHVGYWNFSDSNNAPLITARFPRQEDNKSCLQPSL